MRHVKLEELDEKESIGAAILHKTLREVCHHAGGAMKQVFIEVDENNNKRNRGFAFVVFQYGSKMYEWYGTIDNKGNRYIRFRGKKRVTIVNFDE